MIEAAAISASRPLRRVLVLADESAAWIVAGLPQLERIALTLNAYAEARDLSEPIEISVWWKEDALRPLPNDPRLRNVELRAWNPAVEIAAAPTDLILSTHLFLHRDSVPRLLETQAALPPRESAAWSGRAAEVEATFGSVDGEEWRYLTSRRQIAASEREFLGRSGKSQDGMVSRYLNRRVSQFVSRWLLKLPITPSAWSLSIFILPLLACFAFIRGTYWGFVVGALVFQLYSILDGCDGEIARAKFLQSEFGRRLDSLCDLVGNVLLALVLGLGLANMTLRGSGGWLLYIVEGIVAAVLILTSEGIVFLRRSRGENSTPAPERWNGVLYQRHHEFVERSGLLIVGEQAARWLVMWTKRDMAMLAFLFFALIGRAEWSLHLLLAVSAASSALAGNAFLRQPTPALPQEAS